MQYRLMLSAYFWVKDIHLFKIISNVMCIYRRSLLDIRQFAKRLLEWGILWSVGLSSCAWSQSLDLPVGLFPGRIEYSFSITPELFTWSTSSIFKHGRYFVRFEVFKAVTMKNAVFWDVAPCRYCVNRRFGGTYRLHLQGIKIQESITLKMEAIRSSETSAPHPRKRNSSWSLFSAFSIFVLLFSDTAIRKLQVFQYHL
jgi:hypothetical protein